MFDLMVLLVGLFLPIGSHLPKAPADRPDGPPVVSAKAWAIADCRTGKVLWGSSEAEPLVIASTTKVMTARLVLKLAADDPKVLDERVTFSAKADQIPGSSAKLTAGDTLPVGELLYGLLLPSGNDAAHALAEHFGPRLRDKDPTADAVAAFVAGMNREAAALKMAETRYLDPHGLAKNVASARDLATLAAHTLPDERFRGYVSTRRHECDVTGADGKKRRVVWENTNRLLGIEGYDGVKTGTTTAAGSCLVASGKRGDDHLIVVVLGSTSNDGRYVDTRNLFRWGWSQKK
ncbi:MAG TPA: serine hydrolase [Gemmataceae bacterium]|nr:serine hydrolase [Gemmataceae bacterium]